MSECFPANEPIPADLSWKMLKSKKSRNPKRCRIIQYPILCGEEFSTHEQPAPPSRGNDTDLGLGIAGTALAFRHRGAKKTAYVSNNNETFPKATEPLRMHLCVPTLPGTGKPVHGSFQRKISVSMCVCVPVLPDLPKARQHVNECTT